VIRKKNLRLVLVLIVGAMITIPAFAISARGDDNEDEDECSDYCSIVNYEVKPLERSEKNQMIAEALKNETIKQLREDSTLMINNASAVEIVPLEEDLNNFTIVIIPFHHNESNYQIAWTSNSTTAQSVGLEWQACTIAPTYEVCISCCDEWYWYCRDSADYGYAHCSSLYHDCMNYCCIKFFGDPIYCPI